MTSPSGLWAEGDSLSPTNLNRRNPVGTFPAKTYHVAWAAGTGTTQVTNAIANAVAGGYTTVFVDASRLPYDASLVTFNNAIQMTREGGRTDVVDVKAFGAGGISGDDTDEISAALSWAGAQSGNGLHEVWLDAGIYLISSPLLIPSGCMVTGSQQGFGQGLEGSVLYGAMAGGPILMATGASDTLGIVTSLVSGAGNAYNQATSPQSSFNFRDLDTMDLNGLTAFTAECFMKTADAAAGIMQSGGRFVQSDSNSLLAFLMQLSGGKLQVGLGTTGNAYGSYFITGSTTISDNVVHHVALTWDGTTARIFVDGALEGSHAATGTLIQRIPEQVTIGASIDFAPEQTLAGFGSNITVDSVRFSDTARWTAAFTAPTSKYTSADAHTLALTNFETSIGRTVKAYNKNGNCWLLQRQFAATVAGNTGLYLHSLHVISGIAGRCIGIVVGNEAYNWGAHDLTIFSCRVGLQATTGDVYQPLLERIFVNGSLAGRFGIALGTGVFGSLDDVWIQGCLVGMFSSAALDTRSIFIQEDSSTYVGIILMSQTNPGSVWKFSEGRINTELGTGTNYRTGLLVSGAVAGAGVIWDCGEIETNANKPHVQLDNGLSRVEFRGTSFVVGSGATTSVVQVLGSTTQQLPYQFNGCRQLSGSFIPWSDVTGTAMVGQLGTLFSSSTGSTLGFDASLYDNWDLTLTSDATQSSWTNISYGQPVSGAIKMDSTGSRLFTWPTNSKGTVTLSYGSAAVNTFSGFYDGVNVILTSVRTGL